MKLLGQKRIVIMTQDYTRGELSGTYGASIGCSMGCVIFFALGMIGRFYADESVGGFLIILSLIFYILSLFLFFYR